MKANQIPRVPTKGRFAVCAAAVLACALSANAQIYQLIDKNSVAEVNVGNSLDPHTLGMTSWSVQGQNQLSQQWFWFRVGAAPEAPISTLPLISAGLNNGTRGLQTIYGNAQFTVQVDYLLTGANPVGIGQRASSDIAETISIYNSSGNPLDFHFFQYSDFNLGLNSDSVFLWQNFDGLWNFARQTNPNTSLQETVNTPGATHGEVAFLPGTFNKLNNGVADNLNDNGGLIGPGNVTWALQWDHVIQPGETFQISKDKRLNVLVVPEPSALGLLGISLAGWLVRRRAA